MANSALKKEAQSQCRTVSPGTFSKSYHSHRFTHCESSHVQQTLLARPESENVQQPSGAKCWATETGLSLINTLCRSTWTQNIYAINWQKKRLEWKRTRSTIPNRSWLSGLPREQPVLEPYPRAFLRGTAPDTETEFPLTSAPLNLHLHWLSWGRVKGWWHFIFRCSLSDLSHARKAWTCLSSLAPAGVWKATPAS